MKTRIIMTIITAFCIWCLAAGCDNPAPQKETGTQPQVKNRLVTIGTGGITGVYYPTGGAISKIVNQKKDRYRLRCTVEATDGSVFNINAVLGGDLEFGIAQSDRQYQAVNGMAEWQATGPQTRLRAVFSIHPESVTLIAGQDTGIRTIADLRGKRVNIGNPGSGHRQNAIDALSASGIDYKTDIQTESAPAAEAPGLLQDGQIDALFYTVGHPSGAIKEATSGKRKVRFVSIAGPGIDELIIRTPYYAKSYIPVFLYPDAVNDADVVTFGVKATFVTSAEMPEDMVYAITRELFQNLEAFKSLHPAYSVLAPSKMLEALSAPIHPGALKYYRESGLM